MSRYSIGDGKPEPIVYFIGICVFISAICAVFLMFYILYTKVPWLIHFVF